MAAAAAAAAASRRATSRSNSIASPTPRSLGDGLARLEGRSVLLAVGDMAKAAAALIELDGVARRIVLCPPGAGADALDALARAADADALVYDGDAPAPEIDVATRVACRLPLAPLGAPRAARFVTEWAMPTSGTSGPPKLVAHTLATLTAAFRPVAGAALGDLLRHPPLRRAADPAARADRRRVADARATRAKASTRFSSGSAKRARPIFPARRRIGAKC